MIYGLTDNFDKILENLKECHSDVALSRIIASVIQNILIDIPRKLTVQETLALTESVVLFFFSSIVCEQGKFDFLNLISNTLFFPQDH